MKKILLMAGILVCMLLTACGGKNQEEIKEEAEPVSEVTLYDTDGIRLVLKATMSANDASIHYVVKAYNDNDLERTVKVRDWMINDTIVIYGEEYFWLDPQEERKSILTEMDEALYLEDETVIRSVKCSVEVQDENYEQADLQELTVEIENGLVPALVTDTFLGAKAGKQVLLDNDNVRVTLLGWGLCPSSEYVRGVVYFENKSEDTIPVKVSGISVNGIFLDCSDRVDFLEQGECCYTLFYVMASEVRDEGIESITDVSVLVLTDESQNTGMVNYDGGELYPMELEEKGDTETEFVTGELLEETEEIQITYIGQDSTDWSFSDGGVYEWKLAVVNDSDENIELSVIDLLLDGMSEDEWKGDSQNAVYMSNDEVGAHSKRYVYINVSYKGELEKPELSFRFQIRSMAGGSIIYTGNEQITITPDVE